MIKRNQPHRIRQAAVLALLLLIAVSHPPHYVSRAEAVVSHAIGDVGFHSRSPNIWTLLAHARW